MTSTPPPSTLSTPSPTERDPWTQNPPPDPTRQQAMNALRPGKPIYLIVATSLSPPLGIGLRGQLPWPAIKPDMAFFRKATTGATTTTATTTTTNAVVMGRKTYESVPARFRPLAGRVNVVLTRGDVRGFAGRVLGELGDGNRYRVVEQEEVVSIYERDGGRAAVVVVVTSALEKAVGVEADKVFCIGGAEIYGMVLKSPALRGRVRVLQTRVRKVDGGSFECDTFWPERMENGVDGWREVGKEVVEGWAGVELPQGGEEWKSDEKTGTAIQVVGWEVTEQTGP